MPARAGAMLLDTATPSLEAKRMRIDNSPSAATLTLDNAEDIQDSYVRTRHNNLRCFPKCAPVHKTKSFCGMPLHLTLTTASPLRREESKMLVAEFRNATSSAPTLRLGDFFDKVRLEQQQQQQNGGGETPMFFQGVLNAEPSSASCQSRWILNPPRKWRYEGRTSALDSHVLTMYIIHQDHVVAMVDSPQFRVVPIWRTGEEGGNGNATSPKRTQKHKPPMPRVGAATTAEMDDLPADVTAVDVLAGLAKAAAAATAAAAAATTTCSEEQQRAATVAACLGFQRFQPLVQQQHQSQVISYPQLPRFTFGTSATAASLAFPAVPRSSSYFPSSSLFNFPPLPSASFSTAAVTAPENLLLRSPFLHNH